MAAVVSSTNLHRRAVLAGAAAAMVAFPGVKAMASDAGFAEKRDAFRRAWDSLTAIYADIERDVDALGEAPEFPAVLYEPLRYPDHPEPQSPGKDGWSTETLAGIAVNGRVLTAAFYEKGNEQEVRTRWMPVSAKTRKQAAELLKVREAYDASRKAWWDALSAIEGRSREPVATAFDLAEEAVMYPVFTLADFKAKLAIVEEVGLFDCTNREKELREALLLDAVAVAEKAVAHV